MSTNVKQTKKSVKKSQTWIECDKCKFKFLNNPNDPAHVCVNSNPCELAKSRVGQQIDDESTVFIGKDVLYLNLVEQSKDLMKDFQLSKEYAFDFAFMHPQTMKTAGVELGDVCLAKLYLTDHHIDMLFTCWPSTQVDLANVAVNRNYLQLYGVKPQPALFIKSNGLVKFKANNVDVKFVPAASSSLSPVENSTDLKLVNDFLKEIYANKHLLVGQFMSLTFMGQKLTFRAVSIQGNRANKPVTDEDRLAKELNDFLTLRDNPNEIEIYEVSPTTQFSILTSVDVEHEQNENVQQKRMVTLNDVSGLEKEIQLLKEFFVYPFEYSDLYKEIGVDLSKGVLLYGSSGCGKTMLAEAIINESKCSYVKMQTTEIFSRNYGESESKLKGFFQEAWRKAPCILFIDELDTLCSRRENINQELEKRVVSLFSNLIDQSKSKQILFLCTTNKIDLIDTSLRRPGRLDKEIEIPIPNKQARKWILKNKLSKLNHLLTDEQISDIAQNCHGYVGADLDMLVQEAGLNCVKRLIDDKNKQQNSASNKKINADDLHLALRKIKPSAMREITFDIPKVSWTQIGGQHELKKKLKQAIVWPIKHADSFKRLGLKPPRGILMYGPPGCSKTMVAKALATETGLNFIAVKGPELFSKWVGESERMVREVFRKARTAAPAIIFFDEIDAIAMERSNSSNKSNNVGDRVLAQLLNEMDGVENLNDVTIVAATNRPDMIDKALMRPGRLDRIVYVSLPDYSTRREIFELKAREIPLAPDVNIDQLVDKTEKYSGAELTALFNEAAFLALDADLNCTQVEMAHFDKALKIVTPRTNNDMIKYFENFSFTMGSGLHQI